MLNNNRTAYNNNDKCNDFSCHVGILPVRYLLSNPTPPKICIVVVVREIK